MTDGPERSKLNTALDTADRTGIGSGMDEWVRFQTLLDSVVRALDKAATLDIRGETGQSMRTAFTRSSKGVQEKIQKLKDGEQALRRADEAIQRARTERTTLDTGDGTRPIDEPAPFQPDPEKSKSENDTARGLHQGNVNAYWDRYQRREEEARRIMATLDSDYQKSVEDMKRIHGEPDPPIKVRKPGSTEPTTPVAPTKPRNPVDPPDPTDPRDPYDPTDPDVPRDPYDPADPRDPHDPYDPTDPRDPGDPGDPSDPGRPPVGGDPGRPGESGGPGSLGGIAAGVGGGLGLAGLANAIRGGLAVPGQAVRGTGTRPIGSTSRSAVSGALGRGAAGTGSPVTRGGSRGAGGRGAGRGAVGAAGQNGTRGNRSGRGAGGRGAAAGAGAGRRGNKKDDEEKQTKRDLFDDGQDWIDDEDAATGLLD